MHYFWGGSWIKEYLSAMPGDDFRAVRKSFLNINPTFPPKNKKGNTESFLNDRLRISESHFIDVQGLLYRKNI